MEPVRVKLYGLFPITRRRYLIQQTVILVFSAAAILVWYFVYLPRSTPEPTGKASTGKTVARGRDKSPPPPRKEPESKGMQNLIWLLDRFPAFMLILMTAAVIENMIVLWLFARKDPGLPTIAGPAAAEEKSELSEPTPDPPHPAESEPPAPVEKMLTEMPDSAASPSEESPQTPDRKASSDANADSPMQP